MSYRILSLDGGGAKGFYTLGVLDEIERNTGVRICDQFNLIFGTSTGAIIAALLARGDAVEKILGLYRDHVPAIMRGKNSVKRTDALRNAASQIFGETTCGHFQTGIGIVAANWLVERPFIFKTSPEQAHGSKGSFVPFFGISVADAIVASCSAFPFFKTSLLTKSNGDHVVLADGGFCANDPTLYALTDAVGPLNISYDEIRVISIGVGNYPEPPVWRKIGWACRDWDIFRHGLSTGFLQKILGTNTGSMQQLRELLFKNVPTIRINETFSEPHMATDLLEHNLDKLNVLVQKGRLSYERNEAKILEFLK